MAAMEISRSDERAIHQRLGGFAANALNVSIQTLLTAAYLQGLQDACEVLATRTRPIEDQRGENE